MEREVARARRRARGARRRSSASTRSYCRSRGKALDVAGGAGRNAIWLAAARHRRDGRRYLRRRARQRRSNARGRRARGAACTVRTLTDLDSRAAVRAAVRSRARLSTTRIARAAMTTQACSSTAACWSPSADREEPRAHAVPSASTSSSSARSRSWARELGMEIVVAREDWSKRRPPRGGRDRRNALHAPVEHAPDDPARHQGPYR